MKRIFQISAWLLVLASVAYMTACNTMEGAGEDVQDAGEAIEDAAD